MTPDWERVRALFHAALESDSEQRQHLLRDAHLRDEPVAREVASLLAAHRASPAFLHTAPLPPTPAVHNTPPRRPSSSAGPAPIESLAPGDRLGVFEILAPAGHGGMGEVYKARDLRLDRLVAIKVVSDRHGDDPRARARFEREARAISRLSHPHICTLHDVGVATIGPNRTEVPFFVMEFLEGRTLADRLREGPLAPAEALHHALAIIQALETAHAHGIVHRDLKPANIMLTASGIKLLDFGLAQLRASAIAHQQEHVSISAASSLSSRGVILGTLRYMSPEQLRGEPTDLRSDIFSCGVVLYEMLMGRPPFDERDDASAIAAVLTRPAPPVKTLDGRVDERCTAIVARCLEKEPERRWASMAALRQALVPLIATDPAIAINGSIDSVGSLGSAASVGSIGSGPARAGTQFQRLLSPEARRTAQRAWHRTQVALSVAARALVQRSRRIRRVAVAAIIIALIAMAARVGFMLASHHASARAPAARVAILPPEGVKLEAVQISPDGQRIAMTGWTPEGSRVWIRDLDTAEARPIPGTLGARPPLIWSPDSRRLAFVMSDTLLALDLVTSGTQTIGEVGSPMAGSWSAEDVILLDVGKTTRAGLWRIPASGGTAAPVLRPDPTRDEIAVMFPHFLPDGHRFLYSVHSMNPQVAGVYIGSLNGPSRKRVLPRPTPAFFIAGYLLFANQHAVLAQRFDPEEGELSGEATPLVQADPSRDPRRTIVSAFSGSSATFSASQNGTIVHSSSDIGAEQLAWYDRAGHRLQTIGEAGEYAGFALSKDDERVVASRADKRGRPWNLWMYDLGRGTGTRMTFAANDQLDPRWAPDGRRLAVSATQSEREQAARNGTRATDATTRDGGPKALMAVGLDGAETPLYRDPTRSVSVDDWSPDGRLLLYHVDRDRELLAVPVTGDQSPRLIWRSPTSSAPDQARFSPDGRWVAYHSQESGRPEVYVTRFPEAGERWQVSAGGGVQPIWRSDGRELFYLGLDGRLFAVPIGTAGGFQPASPRALFQTPIGPSAFIEQYAVDRPGSRFLLLEPDPREAAPVIDLVLNWPAILTPR